MTTKSFRELGIKSKNLTGNKIEIEEVINKELLVHDFRIGDSKYNRMDLMTLQIEFDGEKRIIFTQSGVLKEDIQKVAKEDFPFTTTIVEVPINEKQCFYKFT